jgi:uncharacterized membrane protein
MNKAVIGIVLLLISGLAGAFLYIRKLRAKTAESTSKLQAALRVRSRLFSLI